MSLISKDTLEDTEAKQKEIQRLIQGIQKATKQNSDSLVTYCKELKALCDADISNRVVAGKFSYICISTYIKLNNQFAFR